MKSLAFKKVLISLYSMLIGSDGEVDEKEIEYGKKMAATVGIDEHLFLQEVKSLEEVPLPRVMNEALANMNSLTRDEQIYCIAWLCVIANADGFMAETEWKMIYRIYHIEFRLPLREIMQQQKRITQTIIKNNIELVPVL